MDAEPDPGEPDADALLAAASQRLVDAVDVAFVDWVVASVRRFRPDLDAAARAAAEPARGDVVARLRALFGDDVDAQRTTPLTVLRAAAAVPAGVLADAGVPEPERDEFARRVDPDDRYGVAPATWADLGPEVAEAGLVWGAAKAHAHLRRHAGTPDPADGRG